MTETQVASHNKSRLWSSHGEPGGPVRREFLLAVGFWNASLGIW